MRTRPEGGPPGPTQPQSGVTAVTFSHNSGPLAPWIGVLTLAVVAASAAACQPTVKVEAPKEPITINLNVKLDADVRVKLEEQAEQDIDDNPDIF